MDLAWGLATEIGFDFLFKLVHDNKYGAREPKNNTWNGMIGELINGVSTKGVTSNITDGASAEGMTAELTDSTKSSISELVNQLENTKSGEKKVLFMWLAGSTLIKLNMRSCFWQKIPICTPASDGNLSFQDG